MAVAALLLVVLSSIPAVKPSFVSGIVDTTHGADGAEFERLPSRDMMLRMMPVRSPNRAFVNLRCTIRWDRNLDSCAVTGVAPQDPVYGQVALNLARRIRIAQATAYALDSRERHVELAFTLRSIGPEGPLNPKDCLAPACMLNLVTPEPPPQPDADSGSTGHAPHR